MIARAGGVLALGLALIAMDGAGVWWGGRDRRPPAGAEAAVRSYVAAMSVLWKDAGDPRVAERVPAARDLVTESLAGMAFSERRLGVTERHDLVRVEPEGSRWLPDGVAEVRTREFWIYRLRGRDLPEDGVTRSLVTSVRYELVRDGASWRVVDYRLDDGRPGGGE